MNEEYPLEESHCLRSMFVQRLVQEDNRQITESSTLAKEIPKKIIQFWDNLNLMPQDVSECLDTWRKLEKQGVVRQLFDDHQARIFIYHRLGSRYKQAYDRCYHPAMKSDYFRLCYIFMEGGCYIDADDVYLGIDIQRLFNDGRLKIQPLCYDMKTDSMVPPSHFTKQGAIVA